MTDEELNKNNPFYKKTIPKQIQSKVNYYNKWVKKRQRLLTPWKPRPWRTNLKQPFKHSNIFLSLKEKDSEIYSEIKKIDELAGEDEVDGF